MAMVSQAVLSMSIPVVAPPRQLHRTPSPPLPFNCFTGLPCPQQTTPTRIRLYATSEDNSVSTDKTQSPPLDKKSEAKEAIKKGQTTAVVTGAIAVILGVAYLVLVQLLDSRGVNLVPPPPEAFDM